MTSNKRQKGSEKQVEATIRSCYSTWSDTYFDDYYGEGASYPPVHKKIVFDLLKRSGTRTALDAGCGPATFLRDFVDAGIEPFGFDLTPEMIEEARKVLMAQGVPETRVWKGSVLEKEHFLPPSGQPAQFDAAICFGVMPHIPEEGDRQVMSNLLGAVRPGGLVAVEARNALFSLFTLNRYSRDFFRQFLIDEDGLRERSGSESAAFEQALTELDARFRVDLPPVRTGTQGEPGYDEVLSRTHNPFALMQIARDVGLNDVRVLFYHFHALPPMLESAVPNLFKRESLAMENPEDWRGYFMASAFILVGVRPS